MNPEIVINRGYLESHDECLKQWRSAFSEIAKKHPELKEKTKELARRIETASRLAVGDGWASSANADETFYEIAIERENKHYEATEELRNSLEGDFPCGKEWEMVFARNYFTNREIAYIQLGLAKEINPDDYRQVPKGIVYAAGSLSASEKDEHNILYGRKGFLCECLGKIEDAIENYSRIKGDSVAFRVSSLSKKLPFDTLKKKEKTLEGVKTTSLTGFVSRGKIVGATWIKEELELPDGTVRTMFGFGKTNAEGKTVWGVSWDGTHSGPYLFEGEVRAMDIDTSDFWFRNGKDRFGRTDYCVYCGTGYLFFFSGEGHPCKFVALPMEWEYGDPVRVVVNNHFVELDHIENKEDALEVYKLFKAIIDCDSKQQKRFQKTLDTARIMANL